MAVRGIRLVEWIALPVELRGVTLVYGAAGAGKTTFVAWWVRRYGKVFWVSAFEDEATFRANMAKLGYEFGGRLVFWEAPLGEVEAFFNALVDAVARERPEALVVDSVTAFLPQGGVDLLQNLVYRVVRRMGVDVFLTAEEHVAEQLTYLADNVIELKYEVYPYGSFRELVVRKVRGGPAGYTTPFLIMEGEGFVPLTPMLAPLGTGAKIEVLETGTCIDKLAGGVYKGAATAIVGPMGSGKTTLMLMAAKALRERGRKVAYINLGPGGSLVAEKYGVEAVFLYFDRTQLVQTLLKLKDYDAVFVRGLDVFDEAFGREAFIRTLRCAARASYMGPALVVSVKDLNGMDILFDVIIRVGEDFVESVRSPIGKHRVPKAECA